MTTTFAEQVPSREEIREVEDPRERLVLAGARVLVDEGFDILTAGLSPSRVTEMAGRTRRVFYDHFDSKAEFLREVAIQYLDTSTQDLVAQATREEIASFLAWAEGDLFQSIDGLARITHGQAVGSDAVTVQLIAAMMARTDEVIIETLHSNRRGVDNALMNVMESLFEFWGLEPREPWTTQRLALVLRALSDGLYARAKSTGPDTTTEIFSLAIISLLPNAVIPAGSSRVSVEESLRRFADDLTSSWRELTSPGQVDNAYERVLEAFTDELADRGLANTSLDSVAHRCGLSTASITTTFTDLEGLLRAAVLAEAPTLRREADFDLTADAITVADAMRRHLTRLADWISVHRSVAGAVLAFATSGTQQAAGPSLVSDLISAISEPAADILHAGIERQVLPANHAVDDLAALTTETMLLRGTTSPDADLTTTIEVLCALVATTENDRTAARPGEALPSRSGPPQACSGVV